MHKQGQFASQGSGQFAPRARPVVRPLNFDLALNPPEPVGKAPVEVPSLLLLYVKCRNLLQMDWFSMMHPLVVRPSPPFASHAVHIRLPPPPSSHLRRPSSSETRTAFSASLTRRRSCTTK